jgi:murein DD-endopeptidase MepM/ murein hydrolase activator NlpD
MDRSWRPFIGGTLPVTKGDGGWEVFMGLNRKIIFFAIGLSPFLFSPANAAEQSFVFQQGDFRGGSQCTSITKKTVPFYIVKETLYSPGSQLSVGSLVTFHSKNKSFNSQSTLFHILKTSAPADTKNTKINLPLSSLDVPANWIFHIHQSKDSPTSENQFFNGQQIQLSTYNNKYIYKRCCKGNSCTDYPLFVLKKNNQNLMEIAFIPGKNDFVSAYSVTHSTRSADTNSPAQVANGFSQNGFVATPKPAEASLSTSQVYTPPGMSNSNQASMTLTATAPSTNFSPQTNTLAAVTTQQKVVCTKTSALKIYDDSLQTIVYRAQRFHPLKVFQNWNGGSESKTVRGFQVVKVQTQNATGKDISGWAAEAYIKPASECADYPLVYSQDGSDPVQGATVVVDAPTNCCRFPTLNPPSAAYTKGSGKRYFGAQRRGGRLHAAADLLRPSGEKVLAIDGGTILRKYLFYAGTYAIEVKHDMGYVARYGEVAKREVANSRVGERVLKGQHIGFTDHLKMLHFEIYSNKAQGPLTVRDNKYSRRSDLLDPTSLLLKWQEMTF